MKNIRTKLNLKQVLEKIFKLFNIALPTLRITGSIVVFIVGYHMLKVQALKCIHQAMKILKAVVRQN
ncbi:MAG: hypothetical protein ISS16_09175 [Ignavibacteria bacterium]|nr:hypothetical protein [Ignavibacteria bacterium]